MAYSKNILPKDSAYYALNRASIKNTELIIDAQGYAEIEIIPQWLPKLTSKMLVVVHPSEFSDYYTNDAIQVNLSILTVDRERIEILIPVSKHPSGVFNTEIELPEGEYLLFTFTISSVVPVTVYNWELCSLENSEVTVDLEGIEQELPKLLYDYNTYAYAVSQREMTVGLISCFLHDKTDLQGHFTISFFATERCNVHVRIKDNNITELFSPQVYTVEKGYASVSIPHAYLKKLATDHSFSVTMQCTNGQLSIPVRGMLYTIDGGYLATRLLDAGIDIQDISIKQLDSDKEPSEIYAIGYESTRLILKNRPYSLLQRVNWTAIKDFGEGISAAVEFNGSWAVRTRESKYTIETEVQPFVFIVDLLGSLKVYSGSTYEEVIELDTEVSYVTACKGFNSVFNITDDQGLVVVYIKNGNVYYRQYLYDSTINSYTWDGHNILYENGDASFVSIHRLPDYRLGIFITHSAGTKWFITDRTYVSQGFKPEFIPTKVDNVGIATVRPTNDLETNYSAPILNTFEEGHDFYNGFTLTFRNNLAFTGGKNINHLRQSVTVTVNGVLINDAVKTLVIEDNKLHIVLNKDVGSGRTVIIYLNCYYLVTFTDNGCFDLTNQSHVWNLPASTLRFNEEIPISADATLNVKVRQLKTSALNITEEDIPVEVSPNVSIFVGQLKTENVPTQNEVFNVSLDTDISIHVEQISTSPI